MKTKLFKVLILILFISFNILNVYLYSYLTNKYHKTNDSYDAMDSIESEMLNNISVNKDYQADKSKSFKLVKINDKKYDLVDMNYNLEDLFNLFNPDYKDKLDRLFDYSDRDLSKIYLDDKIFNYIDIFGFSYSDKLNYIEIYDKEKVFNSTIMMNSYSNIKKLLGEGTLFINHGDTFDSYIYAYKYKNLYVEFISFYENGAENICVIREDI